MDHEGINLNHSLSISCFSNEPIAKHLEALIVELRKKNEETLIVEPEL